MGVGLTKRVRRPEPAPGRSEPPRPAPVTTTRPELLPDGSGERFRQLVNDLFMIAVRMDAVRGRFSDMLGVTPPQYVILITVAQLEAAGAGTTVRAVAEHTHVSGAFVTAETGKLARMGLVAKRPNPRDGRSVLVTLTAKGRRALAAALPNIRAVNDVFFGKLGAEDFERLSAAAARIVEASAAAVLLAHALSAGARKP
jgi:DNA-binding MarR family transcriptional regulator